MSEAPRVSNPDMSGLPDGRLLILLPLNSRMSNEKWKMGSEQP